MTVARMPDTVTAVIVHMTAALVDVDAVASKIPTPRPARFVVVQRTGGPRATRVSDRPQITIDAWGASDTDAEDLANDCRYVLGQMADGSNRDGVIIHRVDEFAGPAYIPDPDSRQDRYRFTVSVHARSAPSSSS